MRRRLTRSLWSLLIWRQKKMDKETAIGELAALLKHKSHGYYLHLVHGEKNDPTVEKELEALDFAIKYMQNN